MFSGLRLKFPASFLPLTKGHSSRTLWVFHCLYMAFSQSRATGLIGTCSCLPALLEGWFQLKFRSLPGIWGISPRAHSIPLRALSAGLFVAQSQAVATGPAERFRQDLLLSAGHWGAPNEHVHVPKCVNLKFKY